MRRSLDAVGIGLAVVFNYPGTVFFAALAVMVGLMASYAANAGVDPREVSTLVRTAVLMLLLAVPVCLVFERMVHGSSQLAGQNGEGGRNGER